MVETTTPSRWLFDAYSAFRESYEEHFLQEIASQSIAECLARTLVGLREDPILDDFVTVGGRQWYVVSTGGFRYGEEDIPEYLLVYTLDASADPGVIFPLLVCKASAIGKCEGAARSREVVRLIERTLAHVARRKIH